MSIAEPWLGESAVIEWRNEILSTCRATLGKRSLTCLPHWPYCLNFHFGPTTRPLLFLPPRPKVLTSIVLPSSGYSSGLYSKVSMWLGPPYMNRKITLLALAGNGGSLGASGLAHGVFPSAATAWLLMKPSLPSSPVNARDVKPPPIWCKNSRLAVRPQNVFLGMSFRLLICRL